MSQFLLDTDTLSLLEHGNATVLRRINSHPVADIAITAISILEQMKGWQAVLNHARTRQQIALIFDRLVNRLLPVWGRFSALSFPEPAILRFEHLQSLRLKVGPMDLRIAAVALENGLTVVTRNRRDFGRVPGLTVEDWSV